MRQFSRQLILIGTVISTLVSCNNSGSSSNPPLNQATVVSLVSISNARTSPATIEFQLADAEDDPASVQLIFFTAGMAAPNPLTLQGVPVLADLATGSDGSMYSFQWDFAADLGSDFQDGIQVRVEIVDGVQSVVATAIASDVAIGNDRPVVVALPAIPGIVTGNLKIPFRIADSSDDKVNVKVEYDVLGDVPDAGFQLARIALLPAFAPSPEFALLGFEAPREGIDLEFDWDVLFDQGNTDFQAVIRISLEDNLVQGLSKVGSPIVFDNNASAAIINLSVTDARESPATVQFSLLDQEADPQRVSLFFQQPGSSTLEPMTLVTPGSDQNLGSGPTGTSHTVFWDIATDLGGTSFLQGFSATANVLEIATIVSSASASSFDVGNDAPRVTQLFTLPAGEVSGDFDLSIRVADSSNDAVNVAVEYDVIGDTPDAGFRVARSAEIGMGVPTPEFAFPAVVADALGVDLVFSWDVVADESTTDFSAVLRFRIEDDLVSGLTVASSPVAFDNNVSARAEFDGASIAANTDSRRGVPIPFTVFDDESDAVEFVMQWREADSQFPQLPTDVEELRAALSDPIERRNLQIANEYSALYEGRTRQVDPAVDPDGDKLGLPELGTSASGALASGIVGDRLEILNPSGELSPTGHAWSLSNPVAVLPVSGGPSVYVLDSLMAGSWRLREMDLSSGAELRQVAAGAEGDPFAMDYWRKDTGFMALAVGDGTAWSLLEVKLDSGDVSELLPAASVPVAGGVRALISSAAGTIYLTVADSLVRVDSRPGSTPTAVPILQGLSRPWGLALIPTRADRLYLAEAGTPSFPELSGVFEVDLTSLTISRLTLSALTQPRSIALSTDGTQLVALTDLDVNDGTYELSMLTLGGPSGAQATELLDGLVSEQDSVTLGEDELIVLALFAQADLAVTGGLQQVRRISDLNQQGQVVTVDEPFDPAIRSGLTWRLREELSGLGATPGGAEGVFVWDTEDVSRGGDVVLRGVALDSDVGTEGQSFVFPQSIRGPLDVDPLFSAPLAEQPFNSFVAEDLDGDGDVDIASASDGHSILIATQIQPGVFVERQFVLLELGARASAIVAADINGDELTDLVVGGRDGGIFVIEQNLSGDFGPATKLDTDGVSSLVTADLNADGAPDLIATHASTDAVSIFYGNSTSFPTSPDLRLTDAISGPQQAAVADLSGDGLPDLAVANRDSGSIAIYFSTPGAGTGSVADLELAGPELSEATTLALIDLDRDGDRDIVVGYAGIDRVGFFLQDATGDFVGGQALIGDSASTGSPSRVVGSDLDGDGDRDLIVSSQLSAQLAIFFMGSSGEFAPQPDLSLESSAGSGGYLDAVVLDVDGDGRIDIAAANESSQRVDFFYHSRPGDFRSESHLLTNAELSESAEFIQPGDYDGDGDLDFALANRAEGHVSIYFQINPGVFEPADNGPIGELAFHAVSALATGDLDGDGDLDLIAALTGESRIGLAFQTSPGVYAFDPANGYLGDVPESSKPRSVAVADLNGDGDLDIVSANSGTDNISVFIQTSSGEFSASPTYILGGVNSTQLPSRVLAVDIDDDGDVDIVSANRGYELMPGSSGVSIFLQSETRFTSAPQFSLSNMGAGTEILDLAVGDLDDDGDLDLVAVDTGLGALLILEQTARGVFAFNGQSLTLQGESFHPIAVETADFDGDGRIDIATVNEPANRVLIFVQSAPGMFHRDPLVNLSPLAPGGITLSIAAADFDMDGDVDLVTADSVGGAHTVHFGGR